MASVDSRLVWPCKPLCALGREWWHPYTLMPFLKRRRRFVREALLPVKYPGAITLPTIDGVPPLQQMVGNISTRRRVTRKSVDCRGQRKETPARTEGQIYATFRRLTRDERSSRKNPDFTSSRSANSGEFFRKPHGSDQSVYPPLGGASRAFGLPRAAAKRILRAEAHTHFL